MEQAYKRNLFVSRMISKIRDKIIGGKSQEEAILEITTIEAIRDYYQTQLNIDFGGMQEGTRLYTKLLNAMERDGVDTSQYRKRYNGAIGLN